MVEMREAIRQKAENQPGRERGVAVAAQRVGKQKHAVSRQREGEQKQQVERENRVAAEHLNRQPQQAEAEQVVMIRERVEIGIKNVRVEIAGERGRQFVDVPLNHPDLQKRIAGLRRQQAVCKVKRQRPGQRRRDGRVSRDDAKMFPQSVHQADARLRSRMRAQNAKYASAARSTECSASM